MDRYEPGLSVELQYGVAGQDLDPERHGRHKLDVEE